MATCQYGVIITGMRGSAGGSTFSKGGPMQVMKNKGRPGRPMLASQQYSKQQMAKFAASWRDLSGGDRTDWATYAASCNFINSLGQTYQLTGFQMFVRNSLALAQRGAAAVAGVPTSMGKSTLPDLVFDVNSADLRLVSSTPAIPASASLRIAWYFAVAQSINAPRGRVSGTFLVTTESLPLVLQANYSASLAPGVAYRAWVVLRYIDAADRVGDEFLYPVDFTA